MSCGPLHMDEQRQDDQLEPTYSSSVPMRDVALKTYRKQWTIGKGGERGSGISALMARHDDDEQNSFFYFHHSGFSDYCLYLYCYFHNVSADMSSGLLQVFVGLGNLHETSNYVLHWIHGVRLFFYFVSVFVLLTSKHSVLGSEIDLKREVK